MCPREQVTALLTGARGACRPCISVIAASCSKQAFAGYREWMKIQRRTFLATGLTGLAGATMHGLAAASNAPTRFVIHVSGAAGGPVDKAYAPFITELEKRGFPSMFVHSSALQP